MEKAPKIKLMPGNMKATIIAHVNEMMAEFTEADLAELTSVSFRFKTKIASFKLKTVHKAK
jgi:hypothetical protein